jgi:predicted mannosyl-3-phosphoglycerate phosphatase (HAD superfamily)
MALRQGIVDSIADPRLRAAVQMPKARLDELCKADKDARDTYISGTLNARVLALGLEIAKALPDLPESIVMIKKAEEDAKRRAAAQAERRGKEKAAKIENAKAQRAPQQPTASKDAPAPAPAVKGMTYSTRVNNLVVEAINALKATGKNGTEKDLVFLNALKAALEEYNKK